MNLRERFGHSLPYRLARVAKDFFTDRKLKKETQGFDTIVWTPFWLGIGDEFMCSSVLEELHRRGAQAICLMTSSPDLFRHNPRVGKLMRSRVEDTASFERLGRTVLRPGAWQGHLPDDPDAQVPPTRHLIGELNHYAGLRGRVRLQPTLYLQPEELAKGAPAAGRVAIMSTGLNARHPFLNKTWSAEKFQAVVDRCRSRYEFIQLGAASDPLLAGVIDSRGVPLREAAALLAQSRFFVGQEGFLMHLARSVNCRSVVVFGGRIAPHQAGYACNENLFTQLPCSPCWREHTCAYDRECLKRISPDDVIEAMARLEGRLHEPVAEEWAEI